MANQSSFHEIAQDLRATGSKDQNTGIVHGGIYYPAHRTAEGKLISARWEGQFYINNLGYTDSEGNFHEPKNIPIRITAWNGKNSSAGKGLADLMAKCISPGKEISAVLRIDYFEKRLYINNIPQSDHNGQPIKYPAYGWLIKSDLKFGEDSSNTVAQEIANWSGIPNFFSRPALWNVENTGDKEAWKMVVAHRMATVYQGEPTYGYARVMIPEGATPVFQAGQTGQTGVTPPPPNTGMAVPPPPSSGTVPPPPKPSGPTLEQLKSAGWTEEQIKADQRFAHLIPKVATPTGPTLEQLIKTGWTHAQISADPRFKHLAPQTGAAPTSAATTMAPGATPLTNETGL